MKEEREEFLKNLIYSFAIGSLIFFVIFVMVLPHKSKKEKEEMMRFFNSGGALLCENIIDHDFVVSQANGFVYANNLDLFLKFAGDGNVRVEEVNPNRCYPLKVGGGKND